MCAGLGFTHLPCSLLKVKRDIFFPIAAFLEIVHTWDYLKKKQIFLHSVRENASKQEKRFLVPFVYTHTHTNTYMHIYVYTCIYRAAANIIIVMKQL